MKKAQIIRMTEQHARAIASWDFGAGYEFYNIEGDEEVIASFLNGHYYCVMEEGELIAFFCDGDMARLDFDYEDADYLDIGFALRPDLTSRGLGPSLMVMIMDYYQADHYRLTVATFNERAIRLYRRLGFQVKQQFVVKDWLESYEFLVMVNSFQPQDR